jgi:hypothetical protein
LGGIYSTHLRSGNYLSFISANEGAPFKKDTHRLKLLVLESFPKLHTILEFY